MISQLSIKNFKSIRNLEIDCKKINLFIGEPNTGKSNILEAMGLLSWCCYLNNIKGYVRFQGLQNLFYDDLVDRVLQVSTAPIGACISIELKNNRFLVSKQAGKSNPHPVAQFNDYTGNALSSSASASELQFIKFYRFVRKESFPGQPSSFLMPPDGNNMFSVVNGSQDHRDLMKEFFKKYDLSLVRKPQENKFEVQKQVGDEIINYPYVLTSDTLQRIIFYMLAMESNKNSTLVFEEPEAHAFPYYTKFLGERIAMDETNQYFIATHNPYLLMAVLEKAPKDSVNIFITYFDEFQTKVRKIQESEMPALVDSDPFFNLNAYFEEAGK
ncbi:MAG TPA: AAA family ATPase [Spirochaetota bacterium]|nr:AAA family ATPase [Spirochaetota bacterium]HPN29482.1 AAA family ATPase [bacterium]HPN29503.1 AAA family ATPase [bacterium]